MRPSIRSTAATSRPMMTPRTSAAGQEIESAKTSTERIPATAVDVARASGEVQTAGGGRAVMHGATMGAARPMTMAALSPGIVIAATQVLADRTMTSPETWAETLATA